MIDYQKKKRNFHKMMVETFNYDTDVSSFLLPLEIVNKVRDIESGCLSCCPENDSCNPNI